MEGKKNPRITWYAITILSQKKKKELSIIQIIKFTPVFQAIINVATKEENNEL